MKAEFIEQREQIQTKHPEDLKRKEACHVFVWGLWVFIDGDCLVYVSPQASRNGLEQRPGVIP